MKRFIIVIFTFSALYFSQSILKFDKKFVECEDKWIAFQANKDSLFSFGFIYIDEMAGLTFNYEGNFRISNDGKFIVKKNDSLSSIKYRLQPNNVMIALIPRNKFSELSIKEKPSWLANYKKDTLSEKRLYRWGFLYNEWNMCKKAIDFLEEGNKLYPENKDIAIELCFSYNCLELYPKAISVLKKLIEKHPTDAYINKELVYALTKSDNLEEAEKACEKAIKMCDDTEYNKEMYYNLLVVYYNKKDKKKFNSIMNISIKWFSEDDNLKKAVDDMKKQINK